eukprot:CAMPEP_0182942818 /NCGR_PEP_ID=MMETSP0105_2-20130417/51379_1 /TAXON_ID=81532 ORGANISM="Acanthoeca-like sp., Strain 10tr" /NCGR_SAMPLE_ID=MMETSP0105_2 /ASSEMBLY_ACC=CAM_ASM_000205 /LENGTH=423 /DNA_ID=CAMNT_0025082607 /DNA_START=42 /DNA_END=1313 /DNA_ORIENTATION=+
MSKRRILVAKRRFKDGGAAAPAASGGTEAKKSNVFGGLKLTKSPAAGGSSLAASGFGSKFPRKSPKLSSPASGSGSSLAASGFGSKFPRKSPKLSSPGDKAAPAFKQPMAKQSPAVAGAVKAPRAAKFGKIGKSPAGKSDTTALAGRFEALNQAFLRSVEAQVGPGKPVIDLTPCCEGYIKYARSLATDSPPAPGTGTAAAASAVAAVAKIAPTITAPAAAAAAAPSAADAVGDGDDGDDGALFVIPRVKVMYLKYFKTGDKGEVEVFLKHEVAQAKADTSSGSGSKWSERGRGKLAIVDVEGKRALSVRSTDHSDKMYIVNLPLSAITPQKSGTKGIMFASVPNPPHHQQCPVCGEKYPNLCRPCKNGCDGGGYKSELDNRETIKDHVPPEGTKEDPQLYLIRVPSPELMEKLIAKIEELKE